MHKDEFFDEQIIDMINQAQENADGSSDKQRTLETTVGNEKPEPESCNIYTGIKILGKWIYFEPRTLAEGMVTMMVPKDFKPMDLEQAKMKYPSEHRPEVILSDGTGTVNLMFNFMEGKVEDEGIEVFRNQVFGMMQRVNPGIKKQQLGTEEVSGKQIAYAEFSNPAMDGKLYNLMFYLAVEGRPLMGSFNCRTKDMKYWRKAAFEMMQSIRIVEQGADK